MVTRAELKGQWNQIKGRIREKWGEITDNDFERVAGNADQLVGMIEKKTGTARKEIEEFLDDILEQGGNAIQDAAESVREYASHATEAARKQYDRIAHNLEDGYESARETVRARPVESVGVVFAAGLVAGALVSLLIRSGRS